MTRTDSLLVRSLITAVLAAVALTGCVSLPGGSPYGSGYPDNRYPDPYGERTSTLQGDVYDVDHANRRFMVTTDGRGYDSRGQRIEFHYDANARLQYRGQFLAVDGLEPGDGVRVDYHDDGRRLWARQIEVTRNVRDGYGQPTPPYPDNPYPPAAGSDLYGSVTAVEPHNRVLRLRDGNQPEQWMRYDDATVVEYRGQRVYPDQLERGDLIRVQASRVGGVWQARRIVVERSVRGN